MAKTAMIRARIEPDLKEEVEALFLRLGLSVTDAINMFYKQVRFHKGLPFDVKIPNRTTRRAFKLSEQNKGISYYKDTKEMFDKLGI